MRLPFPLTALCCLLAATAAGGAGQTGAEPAATAVAEVVSEPVEVGDVFELEVVVEHPEGAEAAPVVEESLGDFRVLGAVPLEPDGAPAGESRFRLRLGAFVLPGDHQIPPVPVGVRAANGALALIETPPAPVRVVSSLPPDSGEAGGDIHDIRGPFELNVPPRWGAIGLLALGCWSSSPPRGGCGGGGAPAKRRPYRFLRRRRRRRPRSPGWPGPDSSKGATWWVTTSVSPGS